MKPNFEQEPTSILEYWKILKRRRYLFWIPIIAIVLLALYYAISLPPIYRSEATVLIEDQEVSKAIVGAGVAMGSQQVQLVSQRILTVSNIVAIVEKYEGKDSYHHKSLQSQRQNNNLEFLITK